MKILFFEIKSHEADYFKEKLPNHELIFEPNPLNFEIFDKSADVITTHTASKITRQVIEACPNLKLIATRTTGFDHIDLEAAKEHNIVVCNVPAYGEETVAEFTFGLILMISRKLQESANQTKQYSNFDTTNLQGFDLKGKTLGVLGSGRIGQNVIKIAKGFSMNVIAYDTFPRNELQDSLGFSYVDVDELWQKADIITLHLPSTPQTFHLINQETIQKLKKGVVLINTGRGPLIETQALITALDQQIISAAALDVLEVEVLQSQESDTEDTKKAIELNNNLKERANVILTPHNAFNTKEALERIMETTVENINHYLSGSIQNKIV